MARILIVEDELLISMMLEDWLTEIGHQAVGPAATVEHALALIESEALDAVILDYNLRGQRADPVAEVLSARGVPFAISSGEYSESLREQGADLPMLAKPYDFAMLQRVVDALITRIQTCD